MKEENTDGTFGISLGLGLAQNPRMHLPSFLEPALACLPRSALQRMELSAFPGRPTRLPANPPFHRVALVKSEVCPHLYSRPGRSSDLAALAASTLKTFGPLSLFSRYDLDFLIVRLEPAPECQIWREAFQGDARPEESEKIHLAFRQATAEGSPSGSPGQGSFALPAGEVNWGHYDAVVVLDCAVPEKYVRRFPGVFWSYWISETGTPAFKRSYREPLAGYHVFLNGGSRRWRVRPGLRPHVVEMPYILQDSEIHRRLGASPWEERQGIILEQNTARQLTPALRRKLETWGPVRDNLGPPEVRLRQLHTCRYFLQMAPNRLWGNGLNEAVAAGCLALANLSSMPNNRSVLLPELVADDWQLMLARLEEWESHPEIRRPPQERQQFWARHFLRDRPLAEWESLGLDTLRNQAR